VTQKILAKNTMRAFNKIKGGNQWQRNQKRAEKNPPKNNDGKENTLPPQYAESLGPLERAF